MNRTALKKFAAYVALALLCCLSARSIQAQTTAFTYQGSLVDGANPANGAYDLRFTLYDVPTDGQRVSTTLTLEDVPVSNGVFSVTLDFGATAFPGAPRFLQIEVRPGASVDTFTPLTPRQPITSTPYAIKSAQAGTADGLSATCVNCVTSSQIGGLPAGNGNYVQNTTAQQAAANFNISGNGTVGGYLSGNIVNANTQFNLLGKRVLTANGLTTIAGVQAGQATTGASNTFFGGSAGKVTTSGYSNTLLGTSAGESNMTGYQNTFIGGSSGITNTTGGNNTVIGMSADVGSGNLTYATALGAGAKVSASNTVVLGRTADTVQVPGILNVATQYNLGDSRVLSMPGTGNLFVGRSAGQANLTGNNNTFLGEAAGASNISGNNNTLIGRSTGLATTNLSFATALGSNATVSANDTIVLGKVAGTYNGVVHPADTVQIPGNLNVIGTLNAALSVSNLNGIVPVGKGGTGLSAAGTAGNFLRSNGSAWTSAALQAADIPGGSTKYIQNQNASPQAGVNFSIGGSGRIGGDLLVGGAASITSNLSVQGTMTVQGVLNAKLPAGDTGYIQNRTTPQAGTNFNISGNGHLGGALVADYVRSATTINAGTQYDIDYVRVLSSPGSDNIFVGQSAGGNNSSGSGNSFLGRSAGISTTAGANNTFIGSKAGSKNTTGNNNTFIGAGAESLAPDLSYATAIGAGTYVATNNTVIIGRDIDLVGVGTLNVSNKITGPGFKKLWIDDSVIISGEVSMAGNFWTGGNATVVGTLSKGGGSFKIDHPLDPENKYLYHSFVESPDMMNIYNGNVTTDAQGEAVVELPDYFSALNRDFRYQLTVIGQFAQAIVAEKMKDNRFKIRSSLPNIEVSWQITGIRQDAWANKNRIPVEEVKPQVERSYYLHPTAFGQPAERSIEWLHNQEKIKRQKEESERSQRERVSKSN